MLHSFNNDGKAALIRKKLLFREKKMKKKLLQKGTPLILGKMMVMCALVFTVLVTLPKGASAEFSVGWDVSQDKASYGYSFIADWMVANGYYDDTATAEEFAKTGYIGYDSDDMDPYYWASDYGYMAEIVQETAGFADYNTLGYYTGSGDSKSLTQIFGGTENGQKTFLVDQVFGLYLSTPQYNTWFTDRFENTDQQARVTANLGGDAQSLIYELIPGQEWLIAWEDLDASVKRSDNDYNDMFVKVSVVPEPISTTLFLLGGGIMVGRTRLKRKKILKIS